MCVVGDKLAAELLRLRSLRMYGTLPPFLYTLSWPVVLNKDDLVFRCMVQLWHSMSAFHLAALQQSSAMNFI